MIKTYYTYIHRRADSGDVFYVGCATKQTHRRGRDVYQRAYDFGQRSGDWKNIRRNNGVTVEIDREFQDRQEAFEREKMLIASYHELTNISTGGAGATGVIDPEHVRVKKSITKIGELNPMHGKTGSKHHNSRAVKDTVSGDMYPSMTAAANSLGMKAGTLYNMLVGSNPNRTNMEFA